MPKKKGRRARVKKKVQVKDLKPRKDVKGGLRSTRLGIQRPIPFT